jgi:uncharacterized membrane protein
MNHTDELVANYLESLEEELSDLPRPRRRELVQEISEHIDEARPGLTAQSEAEIRTVLDRLGNPADIAAEARERFGLQPKTSTEDEGYGFRRRVVYFFIAVPVVFGVLLLIVSAVDGVAVLSNAYSPPGA